MIFEPFRTGNVFKMRHGNVWATFLMSEQLFYQTEHSAIEQLRNSMELPGVEKITITPDMHTGYGFPIGSVVESSTHLYPDVVGPDPACSVSLSSLGISHLSQAENKGELLNKLSKVIGVGNSSDGTRMTMKDFKLVIRGEFRKPKTWVKSYEPLWQQQASAPFKRLMGLLDRKMSERMLTQLGTIGGGNHFLEICEDEDGNNYVLSHFGSRGIGASIAKWFDGAIAEELKKWNGTPKNGLLFVPVDSELGQMYYMFQLAMLEWATYNHVFVHEAVYKALSNERINPEFLGHVPHNFIELRNGKYIGRKGATPAYDNDSIPLLVPGSMSTGSYVLRPGENSLELGESVAHGAGRVLSRGKAKSQLVQADVNKSFLASGVVGNFRDVPMDESEFAYKNVDEVVSSLVDAQVATIETRLKPVMVLKGT